MWMVVPIVASVYAALPELPGAQREALCLLTVRGLSASVAASVLGVPVGTVCSRADLARRRLRELLGERESGARGRLGR